MRSLYAGLMIFVAACSMSLMGASCTRVADNSANAISPACENARQTLEVCAAATYGTFVVFEEFARSVAEDPALPNSTRQLIIKADERAKPVADSLLEALRQYQRIRAEVAVGKTPEEKLLVATSNLNRWITEAAPLIRNLIGVVNDGTKEATK